MTEFYQFAGAHPWLTAWLAFLICGSITAPFRFGLRYINRYLRSKNIRAMGWPPQHLDADGDFKDDDD
jgi:hypothetical protein